MKIKQTHDVYRDRKTSIWYALRHAIRPIALIEGEDAVTRFGVVLYPYSHPDAKWEDWGELASVESRLDEIGFPATCFAQGLFVPYEVLRARFEHLGSMSQEVDMAELTKEYESELCDFSDREKLIDAALREVSLRAPSKWACQLLALTNELQKTAVQSPS